MRRLLWIVPSALAVALAGYFLGKPATAPAVVNQPTPANMPIPPWAMQEMQHALKPEVPKATKLPGSPELPVTQIVLYSSGVGFFQREGTVEGNARVDLSFPLHDVNDLLKSLVLQDADGGHISAASYESNDPIEKTLNAFAIQLTRNPTNTQILNQARGEKVEITTNGAEQFIGTVIGVDTKPPAFKEDLPVERLNLWCASGMTSVATSDIVRVKFLNPVVESSVNRALEAVALSQELPKKGFSIHCLGSGVRNIRVGYVVESALWRTSYRLLIGKDGKVSIQGWALVDNPTHEDWKNVRMSLVSGRPIAFKTELYKPLFASRPLMELPQAIQTPVQPVTYNPAKPLVPVTDGHAQGTYVNSTGLTGQMQLASGSPVPATSPAWSGPAPTTAHGQQFSQAPAKPIEFQNAGVAAPTATDFGGSYEYAIDYPVTIPRQKSALVPIINSTVEGEKICVFTPGKNGKNPLLALRFKNSTGLHLMPGPVAVFENNGYSGDAQLPDLQRNDSRLLSYAVDLGVEVETANGPSTDKLLSLRLSKGYLTLIGKARQTVTYTVKNCSTHDRVVLVEHAIRSNYRLVSQQQPKERASDVYRFEVKVAAGESANVEVEEERDYETPVQLRGLAIQQVHQYMDWTLSNPQVRPALQELLDLHDELSKISAELTPLTTQLNELQSSRQLLLAKLKETPTLSMTHVRVTNRYDAIETAIEDMQHKIFGVDQRLQKQQEACDECLQRLDFEATIEKQGRTPNPNNGQHSGEHLFQFPSRIPPRPR